MYEIGLWSNFLLGARRFTEEKNKLVIGKKKFEGSVGFSSCKFLILDGFTLR